MKNIKGFFHQLKVGWQEFWRGDDYDETHNYNGWYGN